MNNTVIIGGLFAIGLIALILLVWTLLGEKRTPIPKDEPVKQDTSGLNGSSEPATIPTDQEEQWLANANGQLHELSAELHSLRDQAQQIEQRLSLLTDIVDHLDHADNDVEEEAFDTPTDKKPIPHVG